MSVEIRQGGLVWKARIDTSGLQGDAKRVEKTLSDLTEKQKQNEKRILQSVASNYRSVYQDGLRAFKELNPELRKQVSILTSFQQELKEVSAAQRQLDKDFKAGRVTQSQYAQTTQGLSVRTQEINENIRKYSASIQANRKVMDAANGSIVQKRARLEQLITRWNNLSEAERRNITVGGQVQRQIRSLTRELDRLDMSQRRVRGSGRLMNQVLLATGTFFSITQGTRLVRDIIKVRGEVEQLEVAFSTMLQSKSRADELMREVVQVATTTPFKLTEVADATKQLLAYGFAQEEIKKELLAVGNVASGVGATFGEVAYAYGTLRTQGRAFARDIRQFTTRGIPIISSLAQVMGVAEEKVNDLVSAGKVGFPEVQKAFELMTGSGGQFFNLMEKQSQTVTGEIAKLQDRIQLMFNSIGESNQGLIKDSIAGLAFLVENYKAIGDILTILIATYGSYRAALIATAATHAALGTSTIALSRIMVGLRLRLQALHAAFITSPIGAYTAVITALGLALYSLTKTMNTAKSIQENYNSVVGDGNKAANKERLRIKELTNILESETSRRDQKEAAIKSLRAMMPEVLKGYSDEEIALGKASSAMEKYIENTVKSVVEKQKALDTYNQLGDELAELEAKGIKAIGTFRRLGESLRNVFDPTRGAQMSFSEWIGQMVSGSKSDDLIVNQAKKDLEEQRKSLLEEFDLTDDLSGNDGVIADNKREFDKLIGSTVENFERLVSLIEDKGDAETIKKNLQDYLDGLAPSDPQIAAVKKQLLKINEVMRSWDLKSENDSIKDASKEREKILNQINQMEAKAFKKSFERREQEIEDTKRQFEELRKAAQDAGLGTGVMDRINLLEEVTTGDIRYRNETDKLKEELEKRKKLYEDYEKHVSDFGLQSANRRYENELDTAIKYFDLIQEEYDKLATISPESRSGVQRERFQLLQDELEKEKRLQEQQQNELLKSVQDYETERGLIHERYILKREQLIKNGHHEQLAELERQYKQEIGALDDANAQKLGLYRRFFQGVETMSIRAAKSLIKDLRSQLEELKKNGRVTEGFYREMLGRIEQAERATASRLPRAISDVAGSFQDISRSISESNKAFGETLNIASQLLQRTAQVKDNINAYNQALKANQGAGDALGMAVAGVGVVGAVIGGLSQIANVIKEGQERQIQLHKEQLRFQRQVFYGELAINELYRERALASAEVEGSTLETLEAQRKQLEDNLSAIENDIQKITERFSHEMNQNFQGLLTETFLAGQKEFDHLMESIGDFLYKTDKTIKVTGTGFLGLGSQIVPVYESLAGLTFEEIQELSLQGRLTEQAEEAFQKLKQLKEEGIEVEKALKDIENQLKDIFTGGMSATGLAKNIIAEFQGAGNEIEDIIRNAILSGFSYRFLEGPLNELIDQFAKDAQSGEGLTEGEIARFTQAYTELSQNAQDALNELQQITGIDLKNVNDQQRGLAGAIRSQLTEQTGSELAGLYRAQYEISKRTYDVSHQHLLEGVKQVNYLSQIEVNTANTVVNTSRTIERLDDAVNELRVISKNTKPFNNSRGYTG